MAGENERVYRAGPHRIEGANAEICSVLFADAVLTSRILGSATIEQVVHVLDTRTPHEERAALALGLMQQIAEKSRIGRWLRPSVRLSSIEYQSKFYDGYRDHSIHSISVYLLGWYVWSNIIELREGVVRELRDRARGDLSSLSDEDIFDDFWLLTAFWHDAGYPFECSDFIADESTRAKILLSLNEDVFRDPFSPALSHMANRELERSELRTIYRAGRFYADEIGSAADLQAKTGVAILDQMWKWLAYKHPSPTRKIIELSTQEPQGRPPYHDHGVMGALLLARLSAQTSEFLEELASADASIDHLLPAPLREEEFLEFASREKLVECAVEAVAFHNFPIGKLPSGMQRRLRQHDSPTSLPGPNFMPHLFLVAIVDTLQDWDRHHFVEMRDSNFRPSRRSADFLLQATESKIRITHPGDKLDVLIDTLFDGWVSTAAVRRLLGTDPNYTLLGENDEYRDGGQRARVERSELLLSEILEEIRKTSETATQVMVKDPAMAIPRISERLQDAAERIKAQSRRLLSADRGKLFRSQEFDRLLTLKGMIVGSLALGSEVSRGKITARLGHGGFGTVWAVQSVEQASQAFAYKVFHGNDLRDEEKSRLFRRGFEAMTKLSTHRHIVGVHDYTEFPVGFYMALIEGDDLSTPPRELSLTQRLIVLQTIADTVIYAHRRQVLHRDIKPGNILIIRGMNSIPVVTDFDLAWMSGRSTTIASQLYTSLNYGAPEQFNPKSLPDRHRETVDVYSFGALCYYMIAEGDPPPNAAFQDLHWENLRAGAVRLGASFQVADAFASMVQSCVRLSPEDRLPNMKRAAADLLRVRLSLASDTRLEHTTASSISRALRRQLSAPDEVTERPILSDTSHLQFSVVDTVASSRDASFSLAIGPASETISRVWRTSAPRIEITDIIDGHCRSLEQSKVLGDQATVRRRLSTPDSAAVVVQISEVIVSERSLTQVAATLRRMLQHIEDELIVV